MFLLSWTGWTKDDWLDLVNSWGFRIVASFFIIISCIALYYGVTGLIRGACWLILYFGGMV